jgi:hypothetical protein
MCQEKNNSCSFLDTFSVPHALECKKGGLVISRHNEIRDELSDLASKALSPSPVRDEPKIHTCRSPEVKSDEENEENSVKRLFRNNRNEDHFHFRFRIDTMTAMRQFNLLFLFQSQLFRKFNLHPTVH